MEKYERAREIEARSPGTRDHSAEDDGVHIRSSAAESRSDFEEEKRYHVDPLHIEQGEEHADGEHDSDGAQRKARTDPRQFLDLAEALNDRTLHIRRDGGVQAVH